MSFVAIGYRIRYLVDQDEDELGHDDVVPIQVQFVMGWPVAVSGKVAGGRDEGLVVLGTWRDIFYLNAVDCDLKDRLGKPGMLHYLLSDNLGGNLSSDLKELLFGILIGGLFGCSKTPRPRQGNHNQGW